MRNARKGSF